MKIEVYRGIFKAGITMHCLNLSAKNFRVLSSIFKSFLLIIIFIVNTLFSFPANAQTNNLRGFEIGQSCDKAIAIAKAMRREGMIFSDKFKDGSEPCQNKLNSNSVVGLALTRFTKNTIKDTIFIDVNLDKKIERINAITTWFKNENFALPNKDDAINEFIKKYGKPTFVFNNTTNHNELHSGGGIKNEIIKFYWIDLKSNKNINLAQQTESEIDNTYENAIGIKKKATIDVPSENFYSNNHLSVNVTIEIGEKDKDDFELKL